MAGVNPWLTAANSTSILTPETLLLPGMVVSRELELPEKSKELGAEKKRAVFGAIAPAVFPGPQVIGYGGTLSKSRQRKSEQSWQFLALRGVQRTLAESVNANETEHASTQAPCQDVPGDARLERAPCLGHDAGALRDVLRAGRPWPA